MCKMNERVYRQRELHALKEEQLKIHLSSVLSQLQRLFIIAHG